MGRSIPSFRQLIEIERSNWSEFKKERSSKKEKEAFNVIFENAILYTQYLSNANRPVPIEPIMMGALFHNYKSLLKSCEEDVTEESIKQKLVMLEREKPLANMLFDKTCERWLGLIYSLHRDDREQLLKMLVDCCNDSLDKGAAKTVTDNDSSVSVLFLFCLVLQNQKRINRIKKDAEKNAKTDVNLLDFID
jgi:hypothetical protein